MRNIRTLRLYHQMRGNIIVAESISDRPTSRDTYQFSIQRPDFQMPAPAFLWLRAFLLLLEPALSPKWQNKRVKELDTSRYNLHLVTDDLLYKCTSFLTSQIPHLSGMYFMLAPQVSHGKIKLQSLTIVNCLIRHSLLAFKSVHYVQTLYI